MTLHENPIRNIAVLVSVLDADAADALLEGLPAETAAQVRAQVMELTEIDPGEQQRVIELFLNGARRPQNPLPGAAAERKRSEGSGQPFNEYLAAKASTSDAAANGAAAAPPGGAAFRSLQSVDNERLAGALRREHSQAVAAVLAHLPPPQAAQVLSLLPPRQQAEVVRRIAELDHVDAELLGELDRGLADLVGAPASETPVRTGLRAMREILAAATGQGRGGILKNLRSRDAALAGALGDEPAGIHAAAGVAGDAAAAASTRCAAVAADGVQFEDLIALDDAALGRVLQSAGGRLLLLALAGASEALIERVYQLLPPREARVLRRQIEQQGPISLRDVEEAQRRLARLAAEMDQQGLIALPPQRGFAAAA